MKHPHARDLENPKRQSKRQSQSICVAFFSAITAVVIVVFVAVCWYLRGLHADVSVASRTWPDVNVGLMRRPRFAAQLAQHAYSGKSELQEWLESQKLQLLEWREHWFMAQSPFDELFLGFRGTATPKDVLTDLWIGSVEHEGTHFHKGILTDVRDDRELHLALEVHLTSSSMPVVLCGHSLGGAKAVVFAAAGFVPQGHPIQIFTFGAPAVFYGEPPKSMARVSHYLAFVYEADPVPRLLGTDLGGSGWHTLASAAVGLSPIGFLGGHLSWLIMPKFLAHLGKYNHWGQTVWLHAGRAAIVPEAQREDLLHLKHAAGMTATLLQNPFRDHAISGYAEVLRDLASAMNKVWIEEL